MDGWRRLSLTRGFDRAYPGSVASNGPSQRPSASSLDKTAYAVPGFGKSIALIDLGVKHSVLRQLSQRDCNVTVYPYDISYNELMEQQPDGVILSSGPGDPHQGEKTLSLDPKINGQIPIWGMGLGAQVLAQAYGAGASSHGSRAFRLKYSCAWNCDRKNRDNESKSFV